MHTVLTWLVSLVRVLHGAPLLEQSHKCTLFLHFTVPDRQALQESFSYCILFLYFLAL